MLSKRSQWAISACALTGILAAAAPAKADRKQDLNSLLSAFQKNPAKVMNRHIQKFDGHGHPIQAHSLFSAEEIRTREYITLRDKARMAQCKAAGADCADLNGRAVIQDNDLVENFADNPSTLVRNIRDMDARNLKSSHLDESPWSSTYWPIYRGILADRYADGTTSNENWKANFDYEMSNNASSIDNLSPAEKYDLLVGDSSKSLTNRMWSEGKSYYDAKGSVETWMGICHGWTPASFMYARPKSVVTLTAADGVTKINFYPSDIKGLASLLWANAQFQEKFIGGRCNDKSPQQDENGRLISQDCFDTNPGTWHMAVVNQIGINRRSFVADVTYDYEVWNQPMYGYSYTYFNPATSQAVDNVNDAIVPLSSVTNDKFRKYRSPNAKYLVGVSMNATYVVETAPNHNTSDDASRDALNSAQWVYDLELDSDLNIIGGEWYQNAHPDFLWTPAKGVKPMTAGDSMLSQSWDGSGALPASWRSAAVTASPNGTPLTAIVELMIGLSNGR